MRAVIQRVSEAEVKVDGVIVGQIRDGLLIYQGVTHEDESEDVQWLAKKCMDLRIFPDDEGKMNRSIQDIGGHVLVVSQFTLHAKTKKGTRPSFIHAAGPDVAQPLYQEFIDEFRSSGIRTESGVFGAHMHVESVNDGPVTIIIDTRAKE